MASTAAMLLSAAPAGATTISHPNDVITSSGSDTTEQFMNQVMTGTNEYNVPTITAGKFHVKGDTHCSNPGPSGDPQSDQGISWSSDPNASASGGVGQANGTSVLVAPNGSGDGREALYESEFHKLFKNSTTFGTGGASLQSSDNGCFDIARSSGDPRAIGTNESANFEYYAFALDDVTAASPSRQAPASLSIDQIRSIFNCTITDWSQIPGNAGRGPIQRFFPTASSGTGDTFIKKVLGGDSPYNHSSGSCPAVKVIEENRGDRFVSSTADPNSYSAYIDQAVMPFSAGKWEYFANNYFNPTIDIRGGIRLLGQVPSTGTVGTDTPVFPILWNGTAGKFRMDQTDALHVTEQNTNLLTPTDTGTAGNLHLSGVRYLYNVLDSQTGSYAVARQIAGFDPAANPSATTGGICAGAYASAIIDQGFAALPNQTDSSSATPVRCRKDPVAHP
jgi:ABC-type phosphate transport system substrate-binding protein